MNTAGVLLVAVALLGASPPAWATYPDHPVHLVVGYGAGGGTDLVARAIQPALAKALGAPIIVDNRPGGGGAIGAGFVARAPADGYTILLSSASSVTITPLMNPGLRYRRTSFAAVTQITTAPLVVAVSKETGIHSIPELIAKAKATPGKLNYASSGIGSGPDLAGVLFNEVAGVKLTHVPYRSGGEATLSVLSGTTQVTFATTPSVMPQIIGGQLVGLAVSTAQPSPLVPSLPGMAAAGLPGYEIVQWNGLFVPKGTAADVVATLFVAAKTALDDPTVRHALAEEGTDVTTSASPGAFEAFLVNDDAFWAKLVAESGATGVQ